MPDPKRSSAHSITACGDWSSYSTASSPASYSSSKYEWSIFECSSIITFLPPRRFVQFRRNHIQWTFRCNRYQFRIGAPVAILLKPFLCRALIQIRAYQAFHINMHFLEMHTANDGVSHRRIASKPAAQINIVPLQL